MRGWLQEENMNELIDGYKTLKKLADATASKRLLSNDLLVDEVNDRSRTKRIMAGFEQAMAMRMASRKDTKVGGTGNNIPRSTLT